MLAALFAACGSANSLGPDSSSGPGGGFGGSTGPGPSGPTGPTTTSTGSGGAPPEMHVESSYSAPVATGKYVWIANPDSGRVAYIDATTLQIKLVDAGDGPTYLAAIPDPADDVAIVLNVASVDATLLRAGAAGLTALTLPLAAPGNRWAVSADGHFAIAWTDPSRIMNPDPIEGYQDITVIDLTQGSEMFYDLTVGYRPSAITFDAASKRAFAVTDDGISVVALTGGTPEVVANVALAKDAAEAAKSASVAIAPDGDHALVRRDGQLGVSVYTLADGSRTDVALPAVPTDLAISSDGARAVVVLRDLGQVVLLPVPGIVTSPTSFVTVKAAATVGATVLAPASPVGFFYTNATPSPVLTVMDTSAATPVPTSLLLRAPVLGVFPTRDAAQAVVLHDALTEQGSHYPAAVSLAPIALSLPPRIVGIDAPVVSIAVAPSGDHALVAAGDEARGVYELVACAMPSLSVQKLPLASLPIAAGIVGGAGRGYVAQKHPDGRITFVDLTTGKAQTLTGFELATQVVDGSP